MAQAPTPAPAQAPQPQTVTGVGAAVSRSSTGALLQPRVGGHPVEDAMQVEIHKIQAETDAIAARKDLDDAHKTKLIAELNDPAAMRARILRARDIASGKVKA